MDSSELSLLQALPLDIKVMKSQQRVREWYNYFGGDVYVAFSGGKDSTVLLDIVRKVYPNIPAVFVDTGLEYPEIKEFVKSIENVVILRPKITFTQVIDKYGYPVVSKEQSQYIYDVVNTKSDKLRNTRINGNKSGRGKVSKKWMYLTKAPFKISDKCCNIMKKNPSKSYEKATGNHPILGIMAGESSKRKQDYLKFGCNAFNANRPVCRPIAFWNEQDILQYLVENNLPYAKVYGDIVRDENGMLRTTGEKRTGCMFCMFGVHLDKGENKFQRMKRTHPKIYDYCLNQLNLKEVLDYIKVKY